MCVCVCVCVSFYWAPLELENLQEGKFILLIIT